MPARHPARIIADLGAGFADATDAEVLGALDAMAPLPDERDASWSDDGFRDTVAFRYVALVDVARERRLVAAVEPLLERASFGDPGETMRGLRNAFDAIVETDWGVLTDICLRAARSSRLGTKLWAIEQLAMLDDERARPLFQEALRHDEERIRDAADIGLARLERSKAP